MVCTGTALRKVLAEHANKGVFRYRSQTREYIQIPAVLGSAFPAPPGTGLYKTHVITMLRERPAGSENLFALTFHPASPNELFCSDKDFFHRGPTNLQYINISAFK